MIRSVQKEDDAIRTRVELTPQTPHELMAYDCEKQYECAWVGNAGELRGSPPRNAGLGRRISQRQTWQSG